MSLHIIPQTNLSRHAFAKNKTKDGLKTLKGQEKKPLVRREHENTLSLANKSEPVSQIVNGPTTEASSEKLKAGSSDLTCLPPPEVS